MRPEPYTACALKKRLAMPTFFEKMHESLFSEQRPMTDTEFYRTKRLPPYVFAEVNKLKAAARAAGQDIVDFGMGNPDMPPPSMSSTS